MYVCGDGGAGARFECAFEPASGPDQAFEEQVFQEFGKERHAQLVASGELAYRELPSFHESPAQPTSLKRKDEPLLLATEPAPPAPPVHPAPSKKSEKKKNDNNGIKKKKTR